MKILKVSELISILEKIKEENGDIEVYCDFLPVEEKDIKVTRYEGEPENELIVNIE